jgi:hypothetical protein
MFGTVHKRLWQGSSTPMTGIRRSMFLQGLVAND